MYRRKRLLATLAMAGTMVIAGAQFGDIIGDAIKVIGIGAAVDRFGPDINKAVNKLQGFSNTEATMTKVVPILSIGQGTHIGAAQVMGPPDKVKRVKAVAQLETDAFGKVLRLKALIPIESKNIVSDIKRVPGVGVSAIIDIKL
ncbi:MAG: hypothetical protein IH851_08290 [Armatimonadetes bacterium]|nr:hypothetical protein [Armatimonadota bacterium]